jgi:predicted XRE-type DNA-binding protein
VEPRRKLSKRKAPAIKVEAGSGNVFADLGVPDADETLAKAELAHRIAEAIHDRGLTQVRAAALLGVDQPKVSALLRGRLGGFSTDRLLRFLNLLGRDVDIIVRPHGRVDPGHIRVMGA